MDLSNNQIVDTAEILKLKKEKNELLDLIEEMKKKKRVRNQKIYQRNKEKRALKYKKDKLLLSDCECGVKIMTSSLKKHQNTKKHIHDLAVIKRKAEMNAVECKKDIKVELEAEKLEHNGKQMCEFCHIKEATEFFEENGVHYCTDCEESHKCDNCGYIHNEMIYTEHTDKFGDKLKKKCSLPCF